MDEIIKEKSEFLKEKIKEIKEKIARPCTEFETKNFDYEDENKIIFFNLSSIFSIFIFVDFHYFSIFFNKPSSKYIICFSITDDS